MQDSFGAVGVSERVDAALRKRGLTAPFQIQKLVLRDAIAGRDVLARSPTGSGKTLAFAIPVAERLDPQTKGPGALILVPTRELARQVNDELAPLAQARGLRVAEVYGGVGIEMQARRAANAHAIVATPGRLEDLIQRRLVRLDTVKILVLDEADRMLDLGFQPAVDRILALLPAERQTMFFSATLDGVVAKHAERSTRNPLRVEAELPIEMIGEVEHRFVGVEHEAKLDVLIQMLGEGERDLALVFVRTKRGAARLAKRLEQHGLRAVPLHGDMSQAQRQRSLKQFESGRVDVLVATDVAARGLDVDAVTHVFNFDPPADAVAYTHRVGRTGRAGRSGTGITFVLEDERADITKLADEAGLGTELDLAGLRLQRQVSTRKGGRRGGNGSGGGQHRRRRPAAA